MSSTCPHDNVQPAAPLGWVVCVTCGDTAELVRPGLMGAAQTMLLRGNDPQRVASWLGLAVRGRRAHWATQTQDAA